MLQDGVALVVPAILALLAAVPQLPAGPRLGRLAEPLALGILSARAHNAHGANSRLLLEPKSRRMEFQGGAPGAASLATSPAQSTTRPTNSPVLRKIAWSRSQPVVGSASSVEPMGASAASWLEREISSIVLSDFGSFLEYLKFAALSPLCDCRTLSL